MFSRSILLTLAALVFSVSTAHATSVDITVYTDITGGNTTIDSTHSYVWTFTVDAGYTVDEILGSFVIKDNGADAPITFTLFSSGSGLAPGASAAEIEAATGVLASTSLAPGEVGQQYGTELFLLGPDLNVTDSNSPYSLVLWSKTGTSGAYQFDFKGENNQTLLVTPCVIGGSNVTCGVPDDQSLTEMPEPSTVILTLSGLAFIAVRRWRR